MCSHIFDFRFYNVLCFVQILDFRYREILLALVAQLAVKVGKTRFDNNSFGFGNSRCPKTMFKAFFCLLEATLSFEYSTSAVDLVPKHIYLPPGCRTDRQLPFLCLLMSLRETEIVDQIVGFGQVQKSKKEMEPRVRF